MTEVSRPPLYARTTLLSFPFSPAFGCPLAAREERERSTKCREKEHWLHDITRWSIVFSHAFGCPLAAGADGVGEVETAEKKSMGFTTTAKGAFFSALPCAALEIQSQASQSSR